MGNIYSPTRTCIGCRAKKNKADLIRISCTKDGEVGLDFEAVLPGRGAYICQDKDCLQRMIKSRALNRTFKRNISEGIYTKLEEEFEQRYSEK